MHGPAGGRVLVGYCLWRQGARLVVCDGGGPGVPRTLHGGELAEGGRGLRVVDALAARWGSLIIARAPGRGGAIWGSRCTPQLGTRGPGCVLSCRCATCSPSGRPVAAVMQGKLVARGGSMSAWLTRAGAGLHPGRQLPAGRSCRTALPAVPRICVRQATEATCEPPAGFPAASSSLSSAKTSERRMVHETRRPGEYS